MLLRSHAVVLGVTRSGKTSTALSLLSSQKGRLKIFVNTKRQPEVRKYFRYLIRDAQDMHSIFDEYQKYTPHLLLIEPDVTDKTATDQIAEIFDVVLKRHQDEPKKFQTVVMIDEIHVFQSKFSRNESFARLWTMALGLDCFAVAISQRAFGIHNDILTNSDYIILHRIRDIDKDKLKEYGLIEDTEQLIYSGKHDAYVIEDFSQGLKRLDTSKIQGV